jgi:carbon storage regulator CsrA
MLILSRKHNESITITCENGSIIRIIVTDLSKHHVRLGFDAPKECRIYRTEIQQERDKGITR